MRATKEQIRGLIGGAKILSGPLEARLRLAAHWRVEEPVVVFESDDWGLQRRDVRNELSKFGEPKPYAQEEHETEEDLERLYQVLDRVRDRGGRPAVFTANFVVANPNFEAIREATFEHYFDTPISSWHGKAAWLAGTSRRVFFPQYHGRSHFSPRRWLMNLRAGNKASLELFDKKIAAGLSLIKGSGHSYRSEYLDLETHQTPTHLSGWIATGIEAFESLFGFRPKTTIPPHYTFGAEAEPALLSSGFRAVQGTSYRHSPEIVRHVLGERTRAGLLCLIRTVRFEPCRGHAPWSLDSAIAHAKSCFARGIPVVVDTHRMNYTGTFGESAAAALSRLLEALSAHRPHFLTSPELAEAIEREGRYTDVFDRSTKHLTPIESVSGQALRLLLRK